MCDNTNDAENAGGCGTPAVTVEETPPAMEDTVTEEVVKKILEDHDSNLELIDYDTRIGSQVGDNYMSIMYAVEIRARVKSHPKDEKVISVMLKTIPGNATRRKIVNDMLAFEKEAKTYNEIFKDFLKFQKLQGLRDDEVFDALPACYSSFVDGEADYLAMENLKTVGYVMGNRYVGLDLDHCRLVLTNLAKYHAISGAMFKGDFDAILEKYPYLMERMFRDPDDMDPMLKAYYASTFSSEGDIVRKAGYESEGDSIANLYDDDFYEKMRKLVGSKCKFAVICHGDCWTNNMLFKYDSEGKLSGFKFVDFQLGRAASRTTDLGYFIYTSIPSELLNNHEAELLSIYHKEFTEFAKRLGYVNHEMTLENLQEEMDAFRFYGIATGLVMAPVLSTKTEDCPDMETVDHTEENTQEFMSAFMQSDTLIPKLVTIAVNHVPKLQGGKVGYGEFP